MATASLDDVWIYIYEQGEVRTRDLLKEFVKSNKMSRGTLFKYKHALELEQKIASKPVHERPPYNLYYVPEHRQLDVEKLKQYRTSNIKLLLADDMDWEDAPKGSFLTPAKRKVLWKDEATGAELILAKVSTGLAESLHYHPHATEWVYGLSGECELPNGMRLSAAGATMCVPKGELHTCLKITKEATALMFFDGPRTKIHVSDYHKDNQIRSRWEVKKEAN
jgi:quercetin dioxygenase-like cupin family protein